MRILLTHRFFWPDSPPYASMLRSMGRHFAKAGYDVDVFSAQPSYRPGATIPKQASREILDGMLVRRIGLFRERRKDFLIRSCNGALYSMRLLSHILFSRRYDLVIVSTFPPILPALLACAACKIRGCHLIYHCQDIHPEVSILTQGRKVGFWFGLLKRLDLWTCQNSSAVVVLSEDMRRTIARRSTTSKLNVRVINNLDLPLFETVVKDDTLTAFSETSGSQGIGNTFRIVFTGNLGRFQSLDTVIRAAALLRDLTDLRIVLMGDGVMKEELVALVSDLSCNNVDFIPFQEPAIAKHLIAQADFGLVTLCADMHRVAYPSKTLTYLASGCPLIVMVDPESELAHSVATERLGLAVEETTADALAYAIREGYTQREYWRAEHSRLRSYADKHVSEKVVFGRWEQLLGSI